MADVCLVAGCHRDHGRGLRTKQRVFLMLQVPVNRGLTILEERRFRATGSIIRSSSFLLKYWLCHVLNGLVHTFD